MRFTHALPAHFSLETLATAIHDPHANSAATTMRIELISNAVPLRRGQVLRIVDGAGSTIRAGQGTVWVTEENRPRDVILEAGASYRLRESGVAVIQALSEASLSLD
jgi:hypothetical protein